MRTPETRSARLHITFEVDARQACNHDIARRDMPRPCQKRRASAAAQRKPKPAAPPPIRHKARQKAIHNARRGHGRANNVGGRPSRNESTTAETEQDFISLSSKENNFHSLNGTGSRHNPYGLDSNPDMDLEDGELLTDDDTESDDSEDLDLREIGGDMMINVQVASISTARGRTSKAEVMYTVPAAVLIYEELRRAGFPLQQSRAVRYGVEVDTFTNTKPDLSLVPSVVSQPPVMSSATSLVSHVAPDQTAAGRDYTFNWGKYAGQHFLQVPENYLRTIGGQLNIYEDKHPGLRAAFEYHRPGQGRNVPQQPRQPQPDLPASRPMTRSQANRPTKAQRPQHPQNTARPAFPRSNIGAPSETYRFTKGPHKGRSLSQVPENYLRTLEGMPAVIEKWPRLVPALQDFNRRTGRTGRV